jgi:hypothetical protein
VRQSGSRDTSGVGVSRDGMELLRRLVVGSSAGGAPPGTRTPNPLVKSQRGTVPSGVA